MPGIPHTIAGHCYDEDGDVIVGAKVYIYDKTLDECKNYSDTKFPDLTTNSSGEFSGNLANFDGTYNQGDKLWVSAFYEGKAQNARLVVSGGLNEVDLTLRDLEPAIAVQKFLRAYVADPNTTRANTMNFIKPSYSREELTKSDYPRISIRDTDEDSVSAGITNTNKAEERTYTAEIVIYCWSKPNYKQSFTIGGVSYEGTKLRDYIARKVCEALRKGFYVRPSYDKDAIIQKFYDYEKVRMESEDFDEVADEGIIKKVIEIQFKSIAQTA